MSAEAPRRGKESTEKTRLKERFDAIVHPNITVDTIDTFAETTLTELIELIKTAVEEYKKNHNEFPEIPAELEDTALAAYGLADVGEYLSNIQEKITELRQLDVVISTMVLPIIPRVIIPPDAKALSLEEGSQTFSSEKELIPRFKLLLYILKNHFGIDLHEVYAMKGIIRENMMRQESYITVAIPGLERVVQICEEEGNASYVFDAKLMNEKHISLAHLNNTSKEEKNILISENPGLAIRVNQSAKWRERMVFLLSSPLPVIEHNEVRTEINVSSLPQVETSDFSSWRDFLEIQGQHWGTTNAAAIKLGVSNESIRKYIADSNLASMEVCSYGRKVSAYPFELIKQSMEDVLTIPKTDRDGEWKDFLSEGSQHWGSIAAISTRLGLDRETISKYISESIVPSREVRPSLGRPVTAYPLEIIEQELKNLLVVPQVAQEGEWKGFLTQNEQHWGSIYVIAKRLNTSVLTITKHVALVGPSLPSMKVRPSMGRMATAYPIEIIEKGLRSFLAIPQLAQEGEWKGFLTLDGQHWGSISAIATRLGLDRETISKHVAESGVPSMRVRNSGNKKGIAHPLEVVEQGMEKLLGTPQVAQEGEWEGFFSVDDQHWGPARTISRRLGTSQGLVERLIKKHNHISMEIRDSSGRKQTGYSFEELTKAFEEQKRQK